VSVLELLDAVGAVTGGPVRTEYVDAKPGEMPAVVVSIERARKLGYEPAVSLADGLATAWDEFRAGVG
jgi:UDP-glucose 4-epimerase